MERELQESNWFRDLDSNQDSQLQRLMCYRLHYPGTAFSSLAEPRDSSQAIHLDPCAYREFLLNWYSYFHRGRGGRAV